MVSVKVQTTYSIGDGLPAYLELPHGTKGYDALFGHYPIDELMDLIDAEIAGLLSSLRKYDGSMDKDQAAFCADMHKILAYLYESERRLIALSRVGAEVV